MSDPAPVTPGDWAAGPQPPQGATLRSAPIVIAAVLAVLVLVGAVAAFALRSAAAGATGAGSPAAAAEGLIAAVAAKDTTKAARLLVPGQARIVEVHGARLLDLLAKQGLGTSGNDLSATGIRFREVASTNDVAVVELAAGRVGVLAAGGRVELPVEELHRRLGAATDGKVRSVRLVAVADGARWRVDLLASAARTALAAAGNEPQDPALLVAGASGAGATSPEAAVRGLTDHLVAGDVDAGVASLQPDEARLLGGIRPLLADAGRETGMLEDPIGRWLLGAPGASPPAVRIENLTLEVATVADGVARVTATGGRVTVPAHPGAPGPPQTTDLSKPGERVPVVAVRQGGLWYPSILFTVIDRALAEAS